MTKDYSDNEWIFDPSLANVGRSARRELRDEARQQERYIEQAELQSRTLFDVLSESRNRGDTVAVSTVRRTFTGLVERVANDFVSIATANASIDVAFGSVDYVRTTRTGNNRVGTPPTHAAESFAHHLSSQEDPHSRVEIGMNGREEILMARIPIVGQDHLIAVDDQRNEWTIPLHSVAFVIRPIGQQSTRGRR